MDIPLKKMFSCMVHNLQLCRINIINLVYFPELLIKELTCLDTIHVVLKFLLINKYECNKFELLCV